MTELVLLPHTSCKMHLVPFIRSIEKDACFELKTTSNVLIYIFVRVLNILPKEKNFKRIMTWLQLMFEPNITTLTCWSIVFTFELQ